MISRRQMLRTAASRGAVLATICMWGTAPARADSDKPCAAAGITDGWEWMVRVIEQDGQPWCYINRRSNGITLLAGGRVTGASVSLSAFDAFFALLPEILAAFPSGRVHGAVLLPSLTPSGAGSAKDGMRIVSIREKRPPTLLTVADRAIDNGSIQVSQAGSAFTAILDSGAVAVELFETKGAGKRVAYYLPERYTQRAGETIAKAQNRLLASFNARKCRLANDDCFITSACTQALGLGDDAWELRTLRRFRDERLRAMPGGSAEIAHYYSIAPAINAWLRARPDATRRYAALYLRYILPAACLARTGCHRLARRHYRLMMRRLEALKTR